MILRTLKTSSTTKNNDVPFLRRYPVRSYQDVEVFSTTRHGGVSQGNYGTFNINEFCGDAPDAVQANRVALTRELGIDTDHLIIPHQTHGTEVRYVDRQFLMKSAVERRQLLEGVDAVFTDVPRTCVGVSTADCIPIVLEDTYNFVVCAVHAGWRGTVNRIVQKAIEAMNQPYWVDPAYIDVWIGPGISMEAFEVGDEVYNAFSHAGFNMDSIATRLPSSTATSEDGCKWHIDLVECNRQQLVASGVDEGNIHLSRICTYYNNKDYFSARRQGIASGRIYTGIVLK